MEGADFATLGDAREQAIRSARELIADDLRFGRAVVARGFEIRDDRDQTVMRMSYREPVPGTNLPDETGMPQRAVRPVVEEETTVAHMDGQ